MYLVSFAPHYVKLLPMCFDRETPNHADVALKSQYKTALKVVSISLLLYKLRGGVLFFLSFYLGEENLVYV